MKNIPFFSIITPTYNRAHLISDTIKSVLDQSFIDFELIVVDDGSTDNTEEVVSHFNDERIKYFKKENGERGAARNFGIKKAKGNYLTFLDSDDLFKKKCLQIVFKKLDKQPDLKTVAISYNIITPSGSVIKEFKHSENITLNKKILKGNILSCHGVFIRREILDEINFSEDRKLSGTEDWLLWLKLSARYDIIGINEVGVSLVNHEARSVLNFNEKELNNRSKVLLTELKKDEVFIKKNGQRAIQQIKNHLNTYIALHLIMSNNKKAALKYFFKGIRSRSELFSKRSLAIIKKILF